MLGGAGGSALIGCLIVGPGAFPGNLFSLCVLNSFDLRSRASHLSSLAVGIVAHVALTLFSLFCLSFLITSRHLSLSCPTSPVSIDLSRSFSVSSILCAAVSAKF